MSGTNTVPAYARAYAADGGAVSRTRVKVITSPSSLQVKRTRHRGD